MDNDQLYDDIQEIKTAIVITFLIAIYCFSVIIKTASAHVEWKEICASIGFIIVTAVDTTLFLRLIGLQKESRNSLEDSN